MRKFQVTCRECGRSFEARQTSATFCPGPCRQAFNRRRRDRGAELYDVIMSGSAEPGTAWIGARSIDTVQTLIAAYRAADNDKRGGRQSWQDADDAATRRPLTYGAQGDGR